MVPAAPGHPAAVREVLRLRDDCAIGADDALGQPGRPGRVEDLHDHAGVELAAGERVAGRSDRLFVPAGLVPPGQDRAEVGAELRRQPGSRDVVQEGGGRGVGEYVPQFRSGQPPVERHHDRADAHAGERQLEDARVVLGDEAHSVAASDAAIEQHAGEAAHPVVELAPGQRQQLRVRLRGGERDLVGTAARGSRPRH